MTGLDAGDSAAILRSVDVKFHRYEGKDMYILRFTVGPFKDCEILRNDVAAEHLLSPPKPVRNYFLGDGVILIEMGAFTGAEAELLYGSVFEKPDCIMDFDEELNCLFITRNLHDEIMAS